MPPSHRAEHAFYVVAASFVDECLRNGGSLFTPGRPVWSAGTIADLYARVVENAEKAQGADFVQRLRWRVQGAPREVVQLAAEVLYVLLLPQDTNASTKQQNVRAVLEASAEPLPLPADLSDALARGIASYGAGLTQRPSQYDFLLEFARAWSVLGDDEREALLSDADSFLAFVHGLPRSYASSQVEALLYMVFPDVFEPIVSVDVKRSIVRAFADYVADPQLPLDKQIAAIRKEIEEEYGEGFSFYEPEVQARWEASPIALGHAKAWLVRGAGNHGTNMLPQWFEEDFVSIGWADPEPFAFDASMEQVKEALAKAQPDWPSGQVSRGAGIARRFLAIAPGDLIVSPDGDQLYIARATGDPDWASDPLSCLRRPVEWLNADSPASRASVRDASPKLWSSLRSRLTVLDISDQSDAVARLAGIQTLNGVPSDAASKWETFIHWIGRLRAWEGFEGMRANSLAAAEALADVRPLVEADDVSWVDALADAAPRIISKTVSKEIDAFVDWARQDTATARDALLALWSNAPIEERVRTFLSIPPPDLLGAATAQARVASALLLAEGAGTWPAFFVRSMRIAYKLVGEHPDDQTAEDLYARAVSFLERVLADCQARGIPLADLLDAELAVWAFGEGGSSWAKGLNADERREWEAYCKGLVDPELPARLEMTIEQLAARLHLDDTSWLSDVVALLQERRQIIFFGPPGTGKTYIARQIARLLAESDDRVQLVQFHPSYAYEDFVEGYRPTADGPQPFVLRPGPLLRLAARARRDPDNTYVLVIDEINRGNIPKIFGELYFLLEYRNEAIALQYGEDESQLFDLPGNVLIMGTMNTSDRSIAILDTALRRRFAFVELSPRREPVLGLLRRFMRNKRVALPWLCDVVERANTNLAAHDAGALIGPSHFLKDDIDERKVARIWQYDIMPLIEEFFFDQPREAERFHLERLRADVDGPPEAEQPQDTPPDAPATEVL